MRCPGENFGDRDFNSQEVVWIDAYENANKWDFQKRHCPKTLGKFGGQRWN